uniref:Uncharacterized protein n=1 Tax=Stomoxys calcitrans TaxID=35570 RepID=A0A1I8QB70_STOCA
MNSLRLDTKPSDTELLELCSSAIHFITTQTTCEWKDIETCFKNVIYVYENISLEANNPNCGDDIKKRLHYMAESVLIPAFMKHLAKLPESISNAVIVDHIVSFVNKHLPQKLNMANILQKPIMNDSLRRKSHYLILRHYFSLPVTKTDIALERILQTIGFDTLGYIFCENQHSIYYEKCVIVEDLICKLMRNDQHTLGLSCFMNSIFKCVSSSSKGKALYQHCLKNKFFRHSICKFFEVFVGNLKLHKTLENPCAAISQPYVLQDVLFTLFFTMNSIDSPKEFNFDKFTELRDYINLIFL